MTGPFVSREPSLQFQSEAAECGLACMAMVLTALGKPTDLAALRRAWPGSAQGLTLARLAAIGEQAGLTARPLRLEPDELPRLRVPCVLHWNLDHFVVLLRARRRHAVILDPACGRRRVRPRELSRRFSGVALELAPTSRFDARPLRRRLRLARFAGELRGATGTLLHLGLLSVLLQLFVLAAPFHAQLVIDDLLVRGERDLLPLAAVAFGALALFTALTSWLRARLIVHLGARLGQAWSAGLFRHLLTLPWAWFGRRHAGDIQSRFASLGALRELVTTQAVEALIDGGMAVTTAVLLFIYSPPLAWLVLAAVLAYALLQAAVHGRLMEASREAVVKAAARETCLLETLRAVAAIRTAGGDGGRRALFDARLGDSVVSAARAATLRAAAESAGQLLFGLQQVLLVWAGALQILDGRLSVGMLVAFLAWQQHFSARGRAFVDRLFAFRLARVHLDRLSDIVDTDPEAAADPGPPLCRPRLRGALEVRDAWFRYDSESAWVLRGVGLAIRPGEHVAIAGPSGCGKSTLLKLLVGLLQPLRGEVLVDGLPLSAARLSAYRRGIGVVMQDDCLLAGSLADNVAFFDAAPDLAGIEECCRSAGIHDEIAALPMGYLTRVGELGDALSGGQRQRLLLARALYRRPRLLFLDEATSHLDPAREQQLSRHIAALDITRIVIAHRQETLAHADRVIHLT